MPLDWLGIPQHITGSDILALVGVTFLNVAGIFQFLKNWRRGSAEGLSVWTYVLIMAGSILTAVASWLNHDSFPTRVYFTLGAFGSFFVPSQMLVFHFRDHIFHRYLMRNRHKEPMKEKRDATI